MPCIATVVADDELIVVLSTSAERGRDATHHVYTAKQVAWKTAGSAIAKGCAHHSPRKEFGSAAGSTRFSDRSA